MDAAYIKSTVSAALIEGLSILSRTNPEDPVDYLGKWLVKQADFLDQVQEQEVAVKESSAHSVPVHSESKVWESKHQESGAAVEEADIAKLLTTCSEVTEDVMRQFCDDLGKLVGASGVYIAEKLAAKLGNDDVDNSASNATIKYLSASQSHLFLLERSIREADGGVTWKSWVFPESVEELPDDDATGDETLKTKAAPVLPTIHIPNVLKVSDVYFHQLPRPGAYVAAPIEYGTLVHENALPAISLDAPASEVVDAPEGSDTAEGEQPLVAPASPTSAIPPGIPKQRFLAVCMDTMGQNRDFAPGELVILEKCVDLLKATFLRTELAMFEEEYTAAKEALVASESLAALVTDKDRESQQGAEVEAAAAIEALGEGAADEHKAFAKADAFFKAAKSLVEERVPLIAEVQRRRIQPKPEAVAILQAVWYLLGYTRQQLGDPYSSDALAFNWNVSRKHLGSEFLAALRNFDPAATQKLSKHQSTEAIRALMGGLSVEELNKQNAAFGTLVFYVNAALELREAAAAKKKKEAEEEAERKRKHEEEVAMKAAADAEAAAEREAAEKEAAEKEAAEKEESGAPESEDAAE